MKLAEIIGLKVVAIKGWRTDMRRKKGFSPQWILFSDHLTYIELDDQDYYAYHDCDSSAKTIQVWQNADRWKAMMEDEKHYPDADTNIGW
jgi:hypothetical protein